MLMQAVNELAINLILETLSPLIIKDGRYNPDEKKDWAQTKGVDRKLMPDVIPISRESEGRIRDAVAHPDFAARLNGLTFYVPGSSLRGAWRAHLERVLRGRDLPDAAKVCDPLDDQQDSPYASCCATLTKRKELSAKSKHPFIPYSLSCPICKLFGSTQQAGRLRTSDGIPLSDHPGRIVVREHVRIDRKTGRVGEGGPLKFCGLDEAHLSVELRVRNFELDHVVLLGTLLLDLAAGNIPLGFGKSKGYGRTKAAVAGIELTYLGMSQPADSLVGVAEHPQWGSRFQERYGVQPYANPPALEAPAGASRWRARSPWRWITTLTAKEFTNAYRALAPEWEQRWETVGLLARRLPMEEA